MGRRYEFALRVDGFDWDTHLDQILDLFDDLSMVEQAGRTVAEITIEAPGATEALHTAANRIANVGVTVTGIDPETVAIPDIAARLECTDEAVRLWADHRRRINPPFPTPEGLLQGGTRLWSWARVAEWAITQRIYPYDLTPIDEQTALYFASWIHTGSQPSGRRRPDGRRFATHATQPRQIAGR
jgi:hypothetical protein